MNAEKEIIKKCEQYFPRSIVSALFSRTLQWPQGDAGQRSSQTWDELSTHKERGEMAKRMIKELHHNCKDSPARQFAHAAHRYSLAKSRSDVEMLLMCSALVTVERNSCSCAGVAVTAPPLPCVGRSFKAFSSHVVSACRSNSINS